jgi:hypothetical protein
VKGVLLKPEEKTDEVKESLKEIVQDHKKGNHREIHRRV